MASASGSRIRSLAVREILGHCLATVARATVEIAQIAIIRAVVCDRCALANTASLDLAATIHSRQNKSLLVRVHSAPHRRGRVGGALCLDHTIAAVKHRVDSTIVRINPSSSAAGSRLNLGLDISTAGGCLGCHFH